MNNAAPSGSMHAVSGFQSQFRRDPERMYFSPGRVNLIGEYTDLNGGFVLPSAIDRGTYFAARLNDNSRVNVCSDAFDAKVEIPLSDVGTQVAEHSWSDYVKGALQEFDRQSKLGSRGIDIFVTGDLPRDSGLSSSASFTAGIVFLLNDMWSCGLDRMTIVNYSRGVENNFVGLQCGIMDQFAVVNGKKDHAICLNCNTLEADQIPVALEDYEIVIADSRVPRKLSESAYNQRRTECDAALKVLRADIGIDFLGAASLANVEGCEALLDDPILFKRAHHVTAENERVLNSVNLLRQNKLAEFGQLLYESHASLRDDFEVSCSELDTLVEAAWNISGVLGSRMTGAGLGGCTVSIVASESVEKFESDLAAAYSKATPYDVSILRCRPSDGVKRLDS